MSVITKSVGATGKDYTTVTAALASIPTDIVASGNSYVIELYKDKVHESFDIQAFTTNAARNITIRPGPGQGYRDDPGFLDSNPYRYDPTKGVTIEQDASYTVLVVNRSSHTVIEGLQVWNKGIDGGAIESLAYITGVHIRNNITMNGSNNNKSVIGCASGNVYNNLVVVPSGRTGQGISLEGGSGAFNNTIIAFGTAAGRAGLTWGEYGNSAVQNNAIFGFDTAINMAASTLADGHNATDKATMSRAAEGSLFSLVMVDQFENVTYETADFRLKNTSVLKNAGATVSLSQTSVNNLDRSANGTVYDIGSWEYKPEAASSLSIAGTAASTAGYPTTLRITTNNPLTAGQSFVVALSDAASGTFSPAVTLTDTVPYVDVTYTPSTTVGARTITASTSGLTSATFAFNATAAIDASTLVITGATTGTVGVAMDITVGTNQVLREGQSQTLTFTDGANGQFDVSPIITLSTENPTVVVPYTASGTGGSRTITVTATGTPTLPAATKIITVADAPPVLVKGVNIYNVGTGRQFATLTALCDFLHNKNLRDVDAQVEVHVHNNFAVPNKSLMIHGDATHYVKIRPAPGLGHRDLDNTGALDYGTLGIELTGTGSAVWNVSWGVLIEGFRISLADTATIAWGMAGMSSNAQIGTGFNYNKVKNTGTSAIQSGNYACSPGFRSNLFIRESGSGVQLAIGDNGNHVLGNLFVSRGAATGNTNGMSSGFYSANRIYSNVFVGCGNEPIVMSGTDTPAKFLNNHTNIAPDATKTKMIPGLIVETVQDFLRNVASDLRPNTYLLGKGSPELQASNDLRGNNYGTTPDAGPAQYAPAVALPIAAVTSVEVSGQTVTIRGTTQNTIDSGLASLVPGSPANGATASSATALTLTPNAFEVIFTNVVAGNYASPVLTVSNAGGTTGATGAYGFTILGITGTPMATFGDNVDAAPPVPGALQLGIATADAAIMSGKTATISGTVDMQGDTTGELKLFIDSQPSGVSSGPFAVAVTNGAWSIQRVATPGKVRYRFVVVASSQTDTKSTGTITTLGLVNNVPLPI